MKTYHYPESRDQLALILQQPELQGQRILHIDYQDRFDDFGNFLGEQINITATPDVHGVQVIEPSQEERLEAAELMIDLLLDTQQESA